MKMSEVDVLIESTITEAPVGMLKRGALKVASKFGSQNAAGQEATATIANQLKKEFSRYIGTTGYDQDKDSLEAFLNSKGLSSDSLESAITAAIGTGSVDSDWKINTGGRSTATNQKVDPIVDIGTATDDAAPTDGDSPIMKARAKRAAAQQKATQELRGQQKDTQELRGQQPTTAQDSHGGMGKDVDVPPESSPSEYQTDQPSQSLTGTNATTALNKLKSVAVDPMKGRGSLLDKLKVKQVATPSPSIAVDPVDKVKRPSISSRAANAGLGQPTKPKFTSASAMSQSTAATKDELDKKLNAIDTAREALAKSPKSNKLKTALTNAESEYDAFVSDEVKPADLSTKLNSKVDQIKSGKPADDVVGQMDLPGYEPGGVIQQDPESEPAGQTQSGGKQLDIHDKKKATKKKVSLGSPSATVTNKEKPPVTEPINTSNEKPRSRIDVLTATATDSVAAFKKDPTNKSLGKAAMAAVNALKDAKEAATTRDETPHTASLSSSGELGKFMNRMKPTAKKPADDDQPQDDDDEWMDKPTQAKTRKADAPINKTKAAKNPKMALAASIEHEYDHLLAEAVLSNTQVDKIILAITQDNIRKGIISVPGIQPPKKKPTNGPATNSTQGGQYSAGPSNRDAQSRQYDQPTPANSTKTLDLSDLNVSRLISAINHILKKEELQRFEEQQLTKLLAELKSVKEGRAFQANQLAEAPMGLGQRIAAGVASTFSSQAAGKLDTGKIANQYKPEYSRYLGSTGANPDAQSLIAFFKSKNLDTSKIQQIADSVAPHAVKLTGTQIDSIIMQITQENIRTGKINTAAQPSGTRQPAGQPAVPVIAQRMMNDPAVKSHPEYIRFLSGLK
jgi:hypothetical protein